jgi:TPR repeat protein/class 3 adenylate cyclase
MRLVSERKLVAILAADVAGFSRLANLDEDRTLERLRALRIDLIDPTVARHRGRVVKRTGDGVLVEFYSVVEAVRCALEIQNGMIERNAGLPQDRRIAFRIGIHLGDVVEEGDGDLMGHGVNIAARLEGIAKPGSICLSEDAYRQVRTRLDLAVIDLGENQLKNIAEPVRVYSIEVGGAASRPVTAAKTARRTAVTALLAGFVIAAAAVGVWAITSRLPDVAQRASPLEAKAPVVHDANIDDLVKLADAAFDSKNYPEAYDRYKKAAEAGNAHAQARLGALYYRGAGVKGDEAEAMQWFRKAADQNDQIGEVGIGLLYRYGAGVGRDYVEARHRFEKAAIHGSTRAQDEIADIYANGLGVPADFSVAMNWYRKSADVGDGWAQDAIGDFFWGRPGVQQDFAEAMRWYRIAADQNNPGGQTGLGSLYEGGLGVSVDYGQARAWYQKAAEQGHALAEEDLGRLYENGLGVVRDYSEAMKWYRKAADQGSASAQTAVANLYRDGLGVAKDSAEALRWYRLASDSGYAWAQASLGYMYARGADKLAKDCSAARGWFEAITHPLATRRNV